MKVNCSVKDPIAESNVLVSPSDNLENNLKNVFKICLNKISLIDTKVKSENKHKTKNQKNL